MSIVYSSRALAIARPVAALLIVAAPSAQAEIVTTTITCDNHYAIYTAGAGGIAYVGGNETGLAGNPGFHNYMVAESWSFYATSEIYIAAWSDIYIAQGFLAQFSSASLGTLLTGDARWRVYATGAARTTGAEHPLAAEIAMHVQAADTLGAWEQTYVGDGNGAEPWGVIEGITTDARWIWHNTPGAADPTRSSLGRGQLLVFSVTVPTPAAAFAIALAPLVGTRRRR